MKPVAKLALAAALSGPALAPALPAAHAAPAPASSSDPVEWSNHESRVIRPLAITPDGTKLLAVDTDAGQLSVFSLANPSVPVLVQEIPVGLEPVAVAARTNDEIWVACSVSDAVAIVSLSEGAVVATLPTADEPRDVVFAGDPLEAFVPCGTARTLEVFDVASRDHVESVFLDMWEPAAAVASADGETVYVLSRVSGNGTSIVPPTNVLEEDEQQQFDALAPSVGFITTHDNPAYWDVFNFDLSDRDLAIVDVSTRDVSHLETIGTLNFQLALRPGEDELWVTNTEARNTVRFEPNLKGHAVDSRLTPVTVGTSPAVGTPVDLNPGFAFGAGQTQTNVETGVAQPMGIVFDSSGDVAYVASFGSDRVLELDLTSNPIGITRIEMRPGLASEVDGSKMRGPVGLLLDEANDRLYVWNRVSRSISVVNTLSQNVTLELPLAGFHPVPPVIRHGRGFLYDARLGNGTQSCAVCHDAAREDGLAWDLGDPDGDPFDVETPDTGTVTLHPMKGPMVTQTLQGLKGTEPFHWRGDREDFNAFNPAFEGLLGGVPLSTEDMQAFTDFIETIEFPANPFRTLDDQEPTTLFGQSADASAGRIVFLTNEVCPAGNGSMGARTCEDCHTLGTGGTNSVLQIEASSEPIKTAQLRHAYVKAPVGPEPFAPGPFQTGFGYFHDGRFRDTFHFMATFFSGVLTAQELVDVTAFTYCFPTETAPSVGAMRTIGPSNWDDGGIAADVATLESQAAAGKCDLVAKTALNGVPRGLWYDPQASGSKKYFPDTDSLGPYDYDDLKAWAQSSPISFLGVKPGTGKRAGIDRNANDVPDADETPPVGLIFYGSPTNGSYGTVTIALSGDPWIGNRFTAVIGTGAPPSSTGLFILGVEPDEFQQNGVTLYVDVTDAGTQFFNVSSDETGTAAFQIGVPDDPNLEDVEFHAQLVWTDSGGPQGFSASRRMTVVPYLP